MKTEPVSVHKFGNRIELRIHGWGETGKGDRIALLSEKAARLLGCRLLMESESVDSRGEQGA